MTNYRSSEQSVSGEGGVSPVGGVGLVDGALRDPEGDSVQLAEGQDHAVGRGLVAGVVTPALSHLLPGVLHQSHPVAGKRQKKYC